MTKPFGCPADEELLPLLNEEIISSESRGHLNACEVCRRRLDQLRAEMEELRSVSRVETTWSTRELARLRPAVIGKYLIVGSLDKGGQSRVYRALHPMLDKELAIKLSHTPVEEQSDTRHFLVAEGKLLASLEHPNLARIYDLDFHENVPFLAMEYVRGRDLKRYAAETPPQPRRIAQLIAEVARALAFVHRHGILHQDIKPQNILLDQDDRPRLIDFGMARLRHAWDDGPEEPSGGTPAFMAPEQARGEVTAIGPRSDVFALGGVLFFLLTGQAPFAASDPAAAVDRAARCDFDRAALHQASVPRRLEKICLRAMAAQPADRYADAEELAEDLERYVRRPRLLARLGLAVAAASLMILLGIWLMYRPWSAPAVPQGQEVTELRVQIERAGEYFDLQTALPLNAATDKLQVMAKVPPKLRAVMLYLDPRGKVRRLPAEQSSADTFLRLVFPGDGKQVPLEVDAPGTEFVLVCAASSETRLEGLEDLVASTLSPPLPRLPPKVLVWLNREEPSRQSRPFGAGESDPVAQTEAKLDHLRRRLRDKGISVIQGVAFSH
jgi:eukaryotic-like serine/threonine-protein kinase